MQSMVLSRESISSVYALVILVSPHFVTSVFYRVPASALTCYRYSPAPRARRELYSTLTINVFVHLVMLWHWSSQHSSTPAVSPCGVNRSGTSTARMLKLTERSSVALITKRPAVRTSRNLSLRPWPYLTQSESTEMIFTLSSTGGSTPSQKTFVRVCWPTLMQRHHMLGERHGAPS